jgi:hypothetical protein
MRKRGPVLFASQDIKTKRGDKQFAMIKKMWDKYPDLRKAVYKKEALT